MRQIQSTGIKSPIRKLPPEVTDVPFAALIATTPNLVLWLDADSSVKWQSSGLTTPAVANNDPVGAWVDPVTGRAGLQATSGARPLLILNAYNGKPALRFDGSDDQLVVTGTAAEEVSDITLFIVAKVTSGINQVLFAKNHNTSGWSSPFQRWGIYQNGSFLSVWNGTNTNTTAFSAGDLKVIELCDADCYSNGTKVTDGTDAALTYPNANTPMLISGNGTGSERWTGDICEVIVYGRALTTAERSTIRAALGAKYAVTVV